MLKKKEPMNRLPESFYENFSSLTKAIIDLPREKNVYVVSVSNANFEESSYSLSMIKLKHLTQILSTFPEISEMKILTLQKTILLVSRMQKYQEKKKIIFHFHMLSG